MCSLQSDSVKCSSLAPKIYMSVCTIVEIKNFKANQICRLLIDSRPTKISGSSILIGSDRATNFSHRAPFVSHRSFYSPPSLTHLLRRTCTCTLSTAFRLCQIKLNLTYPFRWLSSYFHFYFHTRLARRCRATSFPAKTLKTCRSRTKRSLLPLRSSSQP